VVSVFAVTVHGLGFELYTLTLECYKNTSNCDGPRKLGHLVLLLEKMYVCTFVFYLYRTSSGGGAGGSLVKPW